MFIKTTQNKEDNYGYEEEEDKRYWKQLNCVFVMAKKQQQQQQQHGFLPHNHDELQCKTIISIHFDVFIENITSLNSLPRKTLEIVVKSFFFLVTSKFFFLIDRRLCKIHKAKGMEKANNQEGRRRMQQHCKNTIYRHICNKWQQLFMFPNTPLANL